MIEAWVEDNFVAKVTKTLRDHAQVYILIIVDIVRWNEYLKFVV